MAAPRRVLCRYQRRAAAREWIKHYVAGVCVRLNEELRQTHRKRCYMAGRLMGCVERRESIPWVCHAWMDVVAGSDVLPLHFRHSVVGSIPPFLYRAEIRLR